MTDVAIYGAGGLGRLVLDILRQDGRMRVVALLDSDRACHGHDLDGVPVLGGEGLVPWLMRKRVRSMIVAIGLMETRLAIAARLVEAGVRLISAIDPSATIASSARIGRHVVIGARAMLCVNARVEDHAIVGAGAIVEHDNVIGRGARLAPAVRLAGGVRIGAMATLGVGACVIPGRKVGPGAVVDAGAVVIRDVPAGCRAGGAPARAELIESAESLLVV